MPVMVATVAIFKALIKQTTMSWLTIKCKVHMHNTHMSIEAIIKQASLVFHVNWGVFF